MIAAAARLPLDSASNVENAIPGGGRFGCLPKGALRAPRQSLRRLGGSPDRHRDRGVGKVPVFLRYQVQLYQITVLDDALPGNAVDGFVVDTDAERAGEAVNLGRSGLGSVVGEHSRPNRI